jgi:hypothetical protein
VYSVGIPDFSNKNRQSCQSLKSYHREFGGGGGRGMLTHSVGIRR